MHIVVCIKQVPDSKEIRIDPKTNTLMRQGVPTIVNYYDMHGMEEALRIKDRYGARVTVLTMGPPSADKALKQCVSMGADEGVLVSDRTFAGADTLATSYVLATAIYKAADTWGPVDVIFAGKQTSDGDTGQVGPGIACRIDYEQLTYVQAIESLNPDTGELIVHRHLEDGVERVKTKTPVLITVMTELNTPRRASLPGMLRAARYNPIVWTTNDFEDLDRSKIGLRGSPTIVSRTWVPEPRHIEKEMLSGTSTEMSELVVEKLFATELKHSLNWA
jgi:electron transfer flavoprotein beta subunit